MKHLDKLLHIAAGFAIYMVLIVLFSSHTIAFSGVILAAVGKEVYDHFYGGTADVRDVYATLGGGVLGVLLWSLV